MSETPQDDVFNLCRAQLKTAVDAHRAVLNRELNRAIAWSGPPPTPTPRWTRVWWRVRSYLSVLWDALRGCDPYDRDEC
jgi:hypothetical protein